MAVDNNVVLELGVNGLDGGSLDRVVDALVQFENGVGGDLEGALTARDHLTRVGCSQVGIGDGVEEHVSRSIVAPTRHAHMP